MEEFKTAIKWIGDNIARILSGIIGLFMLYTCVGWISESC